MVIIRFWQTYNRNAGLVERIKRAWQVLRYGELGFDDVILDIHGLSKLVSNINEVTKTFGV